MFKVRKLQEARIVSWSAKADKRWPLRYFVLSFEFATGVRLLLFRSWEVAKQQVHESNRLILDSILNAIDCNSTSSFELTTISSNNNSYP